MTHDDGKRSSPDKVPKWFSQFPRKGNLNPVADRRDWDEVIASQPPGPREFLQELTNFADLWRWVRECGSMLGPDITQTIGELHKLPLPQRTARLRDVNRRLMERLTDAGKSPELRH